MTQKIINKWKSNKDNKSFDAEIKSLKQWKSSSKHVTAEQVHQKVFSEVDCLECANCCKSIPPIVSNRDSKRIAQFLGIEKRAFEKKYLKIDEDGDQVINASPCPFLKEDNECMVYEVRPAACRAYPHTGENQFFKNINHHKRNAKYCPAVYEILKRINDFLISKP